MIKVGITGGIGSGKSVVCDVWQSLGAYIINADDLAKKLMQKNISLKKKITQEFGEQAYTPGGALNRGYLAGEAFEKGRVKELNQMVHPYVRAETHRLMAKAAQQNYPIAGFEAALLLQNAVRSRYALDYMVIILADEKKRIARVRKRDRLDADKVVSRIQQQQNFDCLRHLGDMLIENNGTLSELKTKAKKAYKQLLEEKIS